jgi:PAS domain S-box-containing protein
MASRSGAAQENKQNERVQLLSDLASSLLLSDNPHEILDEVFKRLSAHLGLEAFFNYLVAEDGSRLRLYNYAGVPEHIAREIEWLDYGQAVCGCVARDKERIIAEDVQCSADPRTGLIKSLGITAYCCHPLIAHDKLIGTLSFGTRNRARFAQDEIELMRVVSDQIASALERKLVEEALKLTQFALDNFGESAIWLTKDGRIVYVNQAACRSLGYSREELLSMHIWDIDSNYPREAIWELWSVRKLDRYTKFESTHMAHDGRVFPVEVTSSYTRYGDEEYLITFDRDITERKRAEEALRGALLEASRFREAMENVSAYIYMKDLQSRYIYANKPTLELFGCSTEELVGSGDDRFFPPETVKRLREVDLRVFAGERTYEEIDVADTGSGRRVYLEIKTPIYEDLDRKTICGLLGISTDITERKRAEEALRESEKQYRGIVEDQTELICLYDLEGKITFVNDAYCRYLGKNREELIGHTFMPLIVEEDREAVKAGIAGLTPENPLVTIEQRALLPDGSVAWQEWKNRIVFDRQGRPTGYQAVGRDITERKRAEESLINSETKFKAIFEGAGAAIFIADVETGNIVECNSNAEILIGRPRSEIIGMHQSRLHPEGEEEKYKKIFASHCTYGCFKDVEAEVQRKDGRKIPVWINAQLLKIGGRDILIGLFFDITERKRTEEELVDAKKQAELYLDLMGHDINNLHQVALGYLELARDMPSGKEQATFLDKPVEVLQRSAMLISNVRKLQKLRDGLFKTELVDICKLLVDVQREFGGVPHKQVTLNLNKQERCLVRANELLHDVFANLVSNAIKHTGDYADITIELDTTEDNGKRYYRVVVEDNGPGIPNDFKGVIFNRALKGINKAKGMGLGLYLVKSLMDSYGGRVWVEDRVLGDHTKGARFVVMLPAAYN